MSWEQTKQAEMKWPKEEATRMAKERTMIGGDQELSGQASNVFEKAFKKCTGMSLDHIYLYWYDKCLAKRWEGLSDGLNGRICNNCAKRSTADYTRLCPAPLGTKVTNKCSASPPFHCPVCQNLLLRSACMSFEELHSLFTEKVDSLLPIT